MQIDSEKLYVGDTWNFSESFSDYPPSTHIVTLYIQKPDGNEIAVEGTEDDEDSSQHEFTVSYSDSLDFDSGTYKYAYQAHNKTTSAKTTFHVGAIKVLPRHGSPDDKIIFWSNLVSALETAYSSWVARGYAEITLPGGDTVKYEDGDKLRNHLALAESKVKSLRASERGASTIKRHQARFTY